MPSLYNNADAMPPRKLHLPLHSTEKHLKTFRVDSAGSTADATTKAAEGRKVLMKVGLGNFALLNAVSYYYGINQTFQMKTQQPCVLRLSILHYCITLWLHTYLGWVDIFSQWQTIYTSSKGGCHRMRCSLCHVFELPYFHDCKNWLGKFS